MKIVCVGGGPAGLYLAILARLRSGGRDEVTVVERNGFGTTQGFGVTFGEELLDDLYETDPDGAREIRAAAHLWGDQVVLVGDHRPVHLGGKYGYSMGRAHLLEILARRADQVGVDLRFDTPVDDPDELGADLVVAADGVGSRIRSRHSSHFGTTLEPGRNRYVWLGASRAFEAFTFAFEPTGAGWVWFYAYPSADGASTCIVECSPETWSGLGLDTMEPSAGLHMLEGFFDRALDGHRLLEPAGGLGSAPWLRFREVRNTTWRRDTTVLAGDAAHTTHFGIGSGTVLAVQDAITLADAVYGGGATPSASGLSGALAAYDARRRAVMNPIQDMARRSMQWFETVDERLGQDPVRFAWSLLDRRGDQGPLHYQLHRATQIEPVRQVRRRLTSARRYRRALRRGELTRAELLAGAR